MRREFTATQAREWAQIDPLEDYLEWVLGEIEHRARVGKQLSWKELVEDEDVELAKRSVETLTRLGFRVQLTEGPSPCLLIEW